MMQSLNLLDEWMAEVVRNGISLTDDSQRDAVENMSVFSIAQARAAGVAPDALDEFLLGAFRQVSRLLGSESRHAWFYAWHDEMSGTLRCSACRAVGKGDLPFACQLNVVDSPTPVSIEALISPYSGGIPFAEFETGSEEQEGVGVPFVLTVFARPLIAAVD